MNGINTYQPTLRIRNAIHYSVQDLAMVTLEKLQLEQCESASNSQEHLNNSIINKRAPRCWLLFAVCTGAVSFNPN